MLWRKSRTLRLAAVIPLSLIFLGLGVAPAVGEDWQPYGLVRVRDMTPFGITRLDLLPAHVLTSPPGTFEVEGSLTYQNTYVMSFNALNYLKSRGLERKEVTAADLQAIANLPGDSYLVDGEFGLADLTLHYAVTRRLRAHATLPYYFFDGGFLDNTVETFHRRFGLDNKGRELTPHGEFRMAAHLNGKDPVILFRPPGNGLGDPVLGARYSLFVVPETWNLVVEGAAKVAIATSNQFISSGHNDYGVQATLQRFFPRQALYLSTSAVYFRDPFGLYDGDVVPTVIAGWEFKLSRHTNGIVQLYLSPSVIQKSTYKDLTADKHQITLGLQGRQGENLWGFAFTENVNNFGNTPDIGFTLTYGRVISLGRVKTGTDSAASNAASPHHP